MDLDTEHGTDGKSLSGKVAFVTGGSRGVGAVTARLLAENGADVAINYRDKARRAEQVAAQVAAAGPPVCRFRRTSPTRTRWMPWSPQSRSDSAALDVLILNASGGLEKDVAEDYAMLLNRDAQVQLVQKALPSCRLVVALYSSPAISPISTVSNRCCRSTNRWRPARRPEKSPCGH